MILFWELYMMPFWCDFSRETRNSLMHPEGLCASLLGLHYTGLQTVWKVTEDSWLSTRLCLCRAPAMISLSCWCMRPTIRSTKSRRRCTTLMQPSSKCARWELAQGFSTPRNSRWPERAKHLGSNMGMASSWLHQYCFWSVPQSHAHRNLDLHFPLQLCKTGKRHSSHVCEKFEKNWVTLHSRAHEH